MLKVTVIPDLAEMRAQMTKIETQQLPFAMGTALTRTASFVAKKEREEIPRVIDAPTKFTLNSVKVNPANKRKWAAEVYIDEQTRKGQSPAQVLAHHIYGGARLLKRAEERLRTKGILPPGYYIVPGAGAPMTANGNIRPAMMVQILSALDAQFDQAQNSRAAAKGKKRKGQRVRDRIFAISRMGGHLRPGVYQRVGEFRLKPLLAFVRRPSYRKRWRFFEIAEAGGMRFPIEFARAMRESVRYATTPKADIDPLSMTVTLPTR
jgi:hypothetical protein